MRYTDEERHAALDCLAANEGDYRRTSTQTGVSVRTLRKWARQEQVSAEEIWQLRQQIAAFQQYRQIEPPKNPREKVRDALLERVGRDAIRLAGTMDEVIDDAPLIERARALSLVLDQYIKLVGMLPSAGEQVIRVEFIDSDGTAHETPYWARGDSEE